MTMELFSFAVSAGDVLASSSSDGDGFPIGALLLLAGPVFYLYVFFRYRNADKRHMHESETEAAMVDVQVADQLAGRVRGSKSARMDGANHRRVKGAQQGFGNFGLNQQTLSNITRGMLSKD